MKKFLLFTAISIVFLLIAFAATPALAKPASFGTFFLKGEDTSDCVRIVWWANWQWGSSPTSYDDTKTTVTWEVTGTYLVFDCHNGKFLTHGNFHEVEKVDLQPEQERIFINKNFEQKEGMFFSYRFVGELDEKIGFTVREFQMFYR